MISSSSVVITSHDAPACQPEVPVFAIGDVHGIASALSSAIDHAGGMLESGRAARVMFLGDLIDRGPQSEQCLRLVAGFRDAYRGKVDLLAGNHEQFMLTSLFHEDPAVRSQAAFNWLKNGGSFDMLCPEFRDLLNDLNLGPEGWLSHVHDGNLLLVHAGVPAAVSEFEVERFLSQPLLELPAGSGTSFPHWAWIRNGFLQSPAPWASHFVVHGHTPWDFTREPRSGRLNLDAGSYKTGRVAGALLTEGTVELAVFNS